MAQTKIIGILNATPDSYFANSRCENVEKAVAYAIELETQGADIIDIGGESTRPGSTPVTVEEELTRIIPLIKALKHHISIPLSIDTTKPEVALAALEEGVTLLNDVSGFSSSKMREIAAGYEVDVCAMHAIPWSTDHNAKTYYPDGVITTLLRWFETTVKQLLSSGISEKHIILDPGIGFGKTVADNLEIIYHLPQLKNFGFPLLLGISRKSFLSKILKLPTAELLPATLTINALAIQAGIDYIRVHDVKEHKEAILLLQKLLDVNLH
ncbi:MAG: dihydropteroate synthase [Parachlamydiaceae bacterium]|nr:dihydropteroate synthase [Parachlamydiaceae bacterium]